MITKTANPSIVLTLTSIFSVGSAAARRPATMHAVVPPDRRLSDYREEIDSQLTTSKNNVVFMLRDDCHYLCSCGGR